MVASRTGMGVHTRPAAITAFAEQQNLIEILRDQHNGGAGGGKLGERLVNRGRGTGIHPQVGWLIISTPGCCNTSRPTRNFCKFPPESERASASGPVVRTSNVLMTCAANSWVRLRLISPSLSSAPRTWADKNPFSGEGR